MGIKVIVLDQNFKILKAKQNNLLLSILRTLESEKRCEYLFIHHWKEWTCQKFPSEVLEVLDSVMTSFFQDDGGLICLYWMHGAKSI